jgi:hypothetical protein
MQVRVIRARSIAFQTLYSRTKNLLHSTKFIFEIYGMVHNIGFLFLPHATINSLFLDIKIAGLSSELSKII